VLDGVVVLVEETIGNELDDGTAISLEPWAVVDELDSVAKSGGLELDVEDNELFVDEGEDEMVISEELLMV
jgi:hypothetical protein